jgi:hypothetical protein
MKHMARQGFISPAMPSTKHREPMLWSRVQVLAVVSMTNLRRRGASLKAALTVFEYLTNKTLSALMDDWRNGRRYILLYGDSCLPRLLPADAIEKNEVLTNIAMLQGIEAPVLVLDLWLAWTGLDQRLKEIDEACGAKAQPEAIEAHPEAVEVH